MPYFYKDAYIATKSIITQRLFLVQHGINTINDAKFITEVEDLSNDFERYKTNERALAYFINKNFDKLIDIIVKKDGWEKRILKLENYLNNSKLINN